MEIKTEIYSKQQRHQERGMFLVPLLSLEKKSVCHLGF